MKQSFFVSTFFLLVFALSAVSSGDLNATPEIPKPIVFDGYVQYDMDEVINTFRPENPEQIEIPMFRKISFYAEVAGIPSKRQTKYLQRLLSDFMGDGVPEVSMGMMLKSKQGQLWQVYIADELVATSNSLLRVGDTVKIYAYHAYSSDLGPGLLVHAFERAPRPNAWQKLFAWIKDVL